MRNELNVMLDSKMKELIKKYGFAQIVNATANACFEIAIDSRKPNTKMAHFTADAWHKSGQKIARTLLVNVD